MNNFLPPSTSVFMRRAAHALAQRIEALPAPQRTVWNADDCPAALLPYLAWSLSVDQWDNQWSADKKRAVIRESIYVHRHKGSKGSVLRMLQAIFGDTPFVLVEGANAGMYDGSQLHNGASYYGSPEHWAIYNIFLARAITIAEATTIRSVMARAAPARCHLQNINYTQALNSYNGAISHDNTYTHGVA